MNWKEYTKNVLITANPVLTKTESIFSATMGLVGESAEVSEIIKKRYFHGKEIPQDDLMKEVGDVCYYLAWFCHLQGIDISQAMERNIEKLQKRHPKGFSSDYKDREG